MEFEDIENEFFGNDYYDGEEEGTEECHKQRMTSEDGKGTGEDKAKLLESVWEHNENEEKKTAKFASKPRPKLTERELLSEKGIPALKAMFDNYKFQEANDPYEKIGILLNKMEYWAHNLFPQMNFDDCLEKIEHLGHKRMVKNTLKRIRLGMRTEDENGSGSERDDAIEDRNETNMRNDDKAKHPHERKDYVNKKMDVSDGDSSSEELDNFLLHMKHKVQEENEMQNEDDYRIEESDSDIEEPNISMRTKKRKIVIDDF